MTIIYTEKNYRETICNMREEKMTYQKIADTLGISRQRVWSIANKAGLTEDKNDTLCRIIKYVGVRNWIIENNMSLPKLCFAVGERNGVGSQTYSFLTGRTNGNINMIKKILSVCNMSFEEAFNEVENEKEEKN